MNANLRFLINPECYHKMCESCVDRTFSHGQAPCPITGCKKMLRKGRFRKQTFEDLRVEREVDIRKNVATVFNRREDEFESLRDYNDYLNEVEDITFNLINSIDLADTEKRFEKYKKAHEQEIAENASLAQQESLSYSALQKAEKATARQRREAARREEAEERREAEENRKDLLRRLEAGQDPSSIAAESQKAVSRQRTNGVLRPDPHQPELPPSQTQNGSGDLLIKGLKAKVKVQPELPIDAFGGLDLSERLYFRLQDDYVWDAYQGTGKEPAVVAGGYDVTAFATRALYEAFSGLGICIADEVASRPDPQSQNTLQSAGSGPQDTEMIDSF